MNSNWRFYEYFFPPPPWLKTRKRGAGYYIFALILAAGGSWLVVFMLSLDGLYPFQTQASTPSDDRITAAFTPSISYWSAEILNWSDTWGLDPLLVATVMQIESCGNPAVVSPAGAQGLFQVMPYHFTDGEDPTNPEINAQRGLAYLHQSNTLSNGDIELTLAGYNGGHAQIGRDRSLWPDETQRYTHWGAAIYNEAVVGEIPSKTLSAWLKAGGWHLCEDAEGILGLE